MSQLARMDEALDQELAAEGSSSGGGGGSGGKVLALASIPSSASLGSFGGSGGPTAFASMSLSMGLASRVLLDALSHAARHASSKRPSFVRLSKAPWRKAAGVSDA